MNDKKLSIITATHNPDLEGFKKTIDSVLPALRDDFEWIIVIHNTDNLSSEDVLKLTNYHDCVRVFEKHDGANTPSAPRNFGIANSVGEYIFFIDDDDLLCPDFLESAISIMDNMGCDVLISNVDVIKESDDILGASNLLLFPKNSKGYIVSDDPEMRGRLLYGSPFLICSKVFKSSLIKGKNIEFDESVCLMEDSLFSLKCYIHANMICVFDELTSAKYLQHENSLLQSLSSDIESDAEIDVNTYIDPILKIINVAKDNNISIGTFLWGALVWFKALLNNKSVADDQKKQINTIIYKYLPELDSVPPEEWTESQINNGL